MIDRSRFLDELRQNPALFQRIAKIVYGEVGRNAPLEKQIIQAETIFNRAISRGQSLDEVTRMVPVRGDNGADTGERAMPDGYYPPSTFRNGARIAGSSNQNTFNTKVLQPVLSGSDYGTQKFGFAPTGNASGKFAADRAASGKYYSRYAWHTGDPKAAEMYVEEKGGRDNPGRIAAARRADDGSQLASQQEQPTPVSYAPERLTPQEQTARNDLIHRYGAGYQPPGKLDVVNNQGQVLADQVPLPPGRPTGAPPRPAPPPDAAPPTAAQPQQTAATPAPSTGDLLGGIAAAHQPGTPWQPTNAEQEFLVSGARQEAPAAAAPVSAPPAVAAGPATTVSARSQAPAKAQTLGQRIIAAEGPRGVDRSSYIDPNTRREILNPPARSGEEAMGITRDLGPPITSQAPRPAAARPNTTPVRPEPSSRPPAEVPNTTQTLSATPRAPQLDLAGVTADEAGRRPMGLAPFDTTLFDVKQTPPLTGGTAAGVPGAIAFDPSSLSTGGPQPTPRPPQADFVQEMMARLPGVPGRSVSAPSSQSVSLSPFEPGGKATPFPRAPELARILAPPQEGSSLSLPKFLEDSSATSLFGGNISPMNVPQPRTTGQQLNLGLSPFAARSPGPTRVAGDYNFDPEVEAWRYNALKQIDQIGDINRNPTPPDARLYPQSSSGRVLPRTPDVSGTSMGNDPMGVLRSRMDPSRDPFLPLRTPMEGYPTPNRPMRMELAHAGDEMAAKPSPRPPQKPGPIMPPEPWQPPDWAARTAPEGQMAQLSPQDNTPPQMQFPSTTLLPFERWPDLGFWGGPGMFDFGSFA